jgi:hypothetical protein
MYEVKKVMCMFADAHWTTASCPIVVIPIKFQLQV